MKITAVLLIIILGQSSWAYIAGNKYNCSADNKKIKYQIELTINSVEAEEGTVTILRKSDDSVVRKEKARYKDGEFFFSEDSEYISIDTYSTFGDEYEITYGLADIKEFVGPIHCGEILSRIRVVSISR